jgi:signal transduction histidine kinase
MSRENLKPRLEAARDAAERARRRVQAALDELEAARTDAATAQLAAEEARDAAESAQAWAEGIAQEAELAQRNLQDFLAMAAHDIRGPLAAIAGYTEVLASPTTPQEHRDVALESIQSAVLQMDRLVEDIVDAGRLGAGAFRLRREPLDLVNLVRRVASGQQATSDRHRIVMNAPERLHGEWDPDRLGQVMTNLISNAIKYSPAGGDVSISVLDEGDSALVSVSDHGNGIRPADVPLLFRPFTRLLTTEEQTNVRGTGLGLYISHGIIQAHGGSIWATSQGKGTGSEFRVRLPLGYTDTEAPPITNP